MFGCNHNLQVQNLFFYCAGGGSENLPASLALAVLPLQLSLQLYSLVAFVIRRTSTPQGISEAGMV